jgi:hypothetical protein
MNGGPVGQMPTAPRAEPVDLCDGMQRPTSGWPLQPNRGANSTANHYVHRSHVSENECPPFAIGPVRAS